MSSMTLRLELNIALIPEDALAARHVALSQKLAKKYPAFVQLNDAGSRLSFASHITLYQVPLYITDLSKAHSMLARIAQNLTTPELRCTGYAYNKAEGSFEISYEVTHQLMALQNDILAAINPLRGELLLEHDPAGNVVQDLLPRKDALGKNIRHTGYGEVGDPQHGGLFRPHVTLNWFELGTYIAVNNEALPSPETFHGRYPQLGVYILGPYGTCPQRIAQYSCR